MNIATEKLVQAGALKYVAQDLHDRMPTKVSQLTNDSGYQTGSQVAATI